MSKREYTQVQHLLPEIKRHREEGKTHREIAEHYGFKNKEVVEQLLARERRKEKQLLSGKIIGRKGRPRKESPEAELERLRMENKLLRDFMEFIERK